MRDTFLLAAALLTLAMVDGQAMVGAQTLTAGLGKSIGQSSIFTVVLSR